MGYNTNQTLVIRLPALFDSTNESRMNYFKHEVSRVPSVLNTAYTSEVPGRAIAFQNTIRKSSQDKQSNFNTYIMNVDHGLLNTASIPERSLLISVVFTLTDA